MLEPFEVTKFSGKQVNSEYLWNNHGQQAQSYVYRQDIALSSHPQQAGLSDGTKHVKKAKRAWLADLLIRGHQHKRQYNALQS